MKLDDLHVANQLMIERDNLMVAHDTVNEDKNNYLGLTLQGRYQDAAFIDAVRPAVMSELRQRMNLIKSQLKQLGVEIP